MKHIVNNTIQRVTSNMIVGIIASIGSGLIIYFLPKEISIGLVAILLSATDCISYVRGMNHSTKQWKNMLDEEIYSRRR